MTDTKSASSGTAAEDAKRPYEMQLKENFAKMIDALELEAHQKGYLINRWLEQVMWMEGRAGKNQRPYYNLRRVVIIGGVIVPALIGLNIEVLRWIAMVISVAVAVGTALEDFYKYGQRWRHYRHTVEMMKSEGWQFFQLSGLYAGETLHKKAFPRFVERIEKLIQSDVETFITTIVQENKKQEEAEKGKLAAGKK